jgi:hypothetical protein
MKLCKEKSQDGKPCPNQVDEGQEYCPYHLASQNTKAKNILSIAGTVLSVVAAGIFTVVKVVAKSKRL